MRGNRTRIAGVVGQHLVLRQDVHLRNGRRPRRAAIPACHQSLRCPQTRHERGCPIFARTLRKGGKPRTPVAKALSGKISRYARRSPLRRLPRRTGRGRPPRRRRDPRHRDCITDDHYFYTAQEMGQEICRNSAGSEITIRHLRYGISYETPLVLGRSELSQQRRGSKAHLRAHILRREPAPSEA